MFLSLQDNPSNYQLFSISINMPIIMPALDTFHRRGRLSLALPILPIVRCRLPCWDSYLLLHRISILVIDVTDLYHMDQDPGDNLDLITAYALPQIDLKAVILDCSRRFRGLKAGLGSELRPDQAGPR